MRNARLFVIAAFTGFAYASPAAATHYDGFQSHAFVVQPAELPEGSYRVAQAGALRFLRNIPKPSLRGIGKVPIPKAPRGISNAVRGGAGAVVGLATRNLPSPRRARSAIRNVDGSSGAATAAKNLSVPGPRPPKVEVVPPLRQMAWAKPTTPKTDIPRPDGPRFAAHRAGTQSGTRALRFGRKAASWFKNNKSSLALFAGLAAIEIVPGLIVDAALPEEGEEAAELVE